MIVIVNSDEEDGEVSINKILIPKSTNSTQPTVSSYGVSTNPAQSSQVGDETIVPLYGVSMNPSQTSQVEDETIVPSYGVSMNPAQTSQVEDETIVPSYGVSMNPAQTSQVEEDAVVSLGLPNNDNDHEQIDLQHHSRAFITMIRSCRFIQGREVVTKPRRSLQYFLENTTLLNYVFHNQYILHIM